VELLLGDVLVELLLGVLLLMSLVDDDEVELLGAVLELVLEDG